MNIVDLVRMLCIAYQQAMVEGRDYIVERVGSDGIWECRVYKSSPLDEGIVVQPDGKCYSISEG